MLSIARHRLAHRRLDLTEDVKLPDDIVAHDIRFFTRGADVLFVDNLSFSDFILPKRGGEIAAVPEPCAAAMIGSIGLIGAALQRRRRAASARG